MVKIFSKSGCIQCVFSMDHMRRLGIEFEVCDIVDSLEFVKGLGYLQVPVIYIDSDIHWSGYRPDRIDALALGSLE